MTKEYIEREKVLKDGRWGSMILFNDTERAKEIILCQPAADVVEVVRCKDCKHRRDDEDFVRGHYCVKRPSNGGYFCEDDDFCSYGERRDNNAAD